MYWNYPWTTSYTSPSTIAVGDVFAGVAATSDVVFGQYYVADNSRINCANAEFNAKMWPSLSTGGFYAGGYPAIVGYSTDTVNGVAPTYSYACLPGLNAKVLLSNDGVNWVESTGTIPATITNNWNPPVRAVFGAVGSQTSLWLATSFNSTTLWYSSTNEGQNWILYANPPGTAFTSGAGQAYYTANTPGNQRLWLLNRGGTTTTGLWFTTNGTTWTAVTTALTSYSSMIAGPGTYPNQTLVVTGTGFLVYSTDSGTTWSTAVTLPASTAATKISYNSASGVYTIVQSGAGAISWTSTNLTTWTANAIPSLYAAISILTNTNVPLANGAVASLLTTTANTLDGYGATVLIYFDGNSVGNKIVSTLPITTSDGQLYAMNSMPNDELWFVGTHQANFVAIMKKSIYIEDGSSFTKAPLGTYKCLGKAGTATNSFLWQRVL
jgi:hypothetical protein